MCRFGSNFRHKRQDMPPMQTYLTCFRHPSHWRACCAADSRPLISSTPAIQRSSRLQNFGESVVIFLSAIDQKLVSGIIASSENFQQFGSSEASIVKVPAETVPSPVEEVPCAGAPLPPCPAFIVPSLNCCGTCVVSRGIHRPFFQFPNVHKKTPDAKSFSILRTPHSRSVTHSGCRRGTREIPLQSITFTIFHRSSGLHSSERLL